MSGVTKNQFKTALQGGVDLSKAGVAALKPADLNGDGILKGDAELEKAFINVDAFDRNGSSASFSNTGKAGQLFGAAQAARVATTAPVGPAAGQQGAHVVATAADRVAKDGANYAYDKAPHSPLAGLSGNRRPEESRPNWLAGNNKCNQFVGDVLTQAGFKAPTNKMPDGSVHYQKAEDWPKNPALFERITDASKVRPGDVVVKDYPGEGASTAHTEVVTSVDPWKTTGAHYDGAYEKENNWLEGTSYNAQNRSFSEGGGTEVYVLRPKQRLQ